MKTIKYIILVVFSLTSCQAENLKESQVKSIQAKTREILLLTKQNKSEEVSERIISPEKSGVKRHAASIESIKRFFDGVDVDKIEFGNTTFDKERNVYVIRIVSPKNLQLEYSVDTATGNPGKLQSIHP
jgi:uncharacterized membrane protein YkoI